MAARSKPAPTQLGLTARQLSDAVTLVRPFIGTDDTLPMLCGYLFEVHGGELYVSGTDRYTLAVARIEPQSKQKFPAGFTALVPASLAHRALTLFKPARSSVAEPLMLGVHGQRTSIENVPSDDATPSTRLVGQPLASKGLSPRNICVDQLVAYRDAMAGSGSWIAHTALNPMFLARFAVVRKVLGEVPILIRESGHSKPVLVTAGDSFFGLQMPVRIPDGDEGGFNAWFDRFDVPPAITPEPAAEPAKEASKPRARKVKTA